MSELTSMMNIGKEMERKLTTVGIDSAEKLIETGSKQAFLKLKEVFHKFVWYICILWKGQFIILSLTAFRKIRKKS